MLLLPAALTQPVASLSSQQCGSSVPSYTQQFPLFFLLLFPFSFWRSPPPPPPPPPRARGRRGCSTCSTSSSSPTTPAPAPTPTTSTGSATPPASAPLLVSLSSVACDQLQQLDKMLLFRSYFSHCNSSYQHYLRRGHLGR